MKYLKKFGWFSFTILISIVYSLIFIALEFRGNPISGFKGFLVIASQWCIITFCCCGVIGALSVNRIIFAIFFPILILISSVLAYFELTMGVQFTPESLELMMMNDFSTWSTVISLLLIIVIILSLTIGIGIAIFRWRYVLVSHPIDYLMLSLLVVATPLYFVKGIGSPVKAKMPYVFYSTVDLYWANKININENRTTFNGVKVVSDNRPLDVIFVIGESLRADHLAFNGYKRPTTPYLNKEKNLISFPNMRSIPYYTHVSVPYILTLADSIHPERGYYDQSFISLFKKAGYKPTWISNQDKNPAYSYFMHECDTIILTHATKSLYNFGKWLDKDILPEFDAHGLTGDKNLTIIHAIGSHWWYPSHYEEDDAIFKPEITSRILSELSREDIVNSYDNTVVATDSFIHSLIERLRSRESILIYISDHGEALGEDGNYLHAEDYPQLHNPACFIWYSDLYGQRYPEKIESLRKNASKRWLSDSMFHSVLDAGVISTPVKVDSLSLFQYH